MFGRKLSSFSMRARRPGLPIFSPALPSRSSADGSFWVKRSRRCRWRCSTVEVSILVPLDSPKEKPWRLECGARPRSSGGVRFRVWSPLAKEIAVAIKSPQKIVRPMKLVEEAIFEAEVAEAAAGADYMYLIDGNKERPDPVSGWQPGGV